MKNLRRAYFSLGSNIGDRQGYLQKAVNLLKERLGKVAAISSVYLTPAWGFDGDDFYNICVGLDTELAPQEVLDEILNIEEGLGRKRYAGSGYLARTIDIDLLFYEDEVFNASDLIIPHPQLEKRRFVLKPLVEIAPGKIHPVFKKTVEELLVECEDESELKRLPRPLKNPSLRDFSKFNYIAIEGNIGAGKTSLATMMAESFNGKLILERFADNPFLPKFYEDRGRYAFPLEMSFLADRYQQFTEDTTQLDLFKNFMVSDYDIYKSLIFAKVTLQEEEFKLYRRLFNIMYKEATKPDLYVYLYQNTERLLANIKKRGRDYEQQIPAEYLEDIHKGYLDFIKTQSGQRVLILDVSDKDFVNNSEDYIKILDEIHDYTES
ncbi:2-amino-4-hydroxy-6-hydroxymethyldihydropteridine diphosphokinase [Sungkyunkwania multivorans]|uniref:2-amino-4-hydroxy-6-hydroxymethyldihydropteridine pyrophosphokinase n=1 Tax=Sungkyunkwania multivorans TaxID=1173618 RepID=A0ABW3D1J5_9FLAO